MTKQRTRAVYTTLSTFTKLVSFNEYRKRLIGNRLLKNVDNARMYFFASLCLVGSFSRLVSLERSRDGWTPPTLRIQGLFEPTRESDWRPKGIIKTFSSRAIEDKQCELSPGGGGVKPLYQPYRYVSPQKLRRIFLAFLAWKRVWFSRELQERLYVHAVLVTISQLATVFSASSQLTTKFS